MTEKFKGIKRLTYSEFCLSCRDAEKRVALCDAIISGHVYIIKSVISREAAKNLLHNIVNSEIPQATLIKIIEGVDNFFYTSNFKKTEIGQYTAIDRSWYFFPWNKDDYGVAELLQPVFNNIIILNNKDPNVVVKQTPKDEFIQRFHLINYPVLCGEISLHQDPVNIAHVSGGVYLTEFGVDYDKGGFYVMDLNDEKVMVDNEVETGDLVLFNQGMPHGVESVESSKNDSEGRYFFSMSLVESHEKPNRMTAVGLD